MRRFQAKHLGKHDKSEPADQDVLLKANILSSQYVLPKLNNATEIRLWLIANQNEKFGENVVDQYHMRRNIKLLIKKYGLDKVIRGVLLAQLFAENPYSTRFIEEQICDAFSLQGPND